VALGALAAALVILAPRAARGDPTAPESRSLWREEWPQFSAIEGFLTSGAVIGMVVFSLAGSVEEPRWKGGNAFDDAARKGMRLPDDKSRRAVAEAGNANYYTFPVIPVAIDVIVVALIARRDYKAALNLFLVTGEALAYSGLLSFVSNVAAARERPDITACIEQHGGSTSGCDLSSRGDSFYSGHTSMASASAGAVCANHSFMPLWGHPVADGFACGLASAAAIVTGVSRVMADRHYLSDVLVGSSLGFGVGFLIPTLLHYRVPGASTSIAVIPGSSAGPTGLTVGGQF